MRGSRISRYVPGYHMRNIVIHIHQSISTLTDADLLFGTAADDPAVSLIRDISMLTDTHRKVGIAADRPAQSLFRDATPSRATPFKSGMTTDPNILDHLGEHLNTHGVSPEKVEAACRILETVHADILDGRSEMYAINERLIKSNLVIEHVVASLRK